MKVDDITIKTDTALLDLGTHFVLEENDIFGEYCPFKLNLLMSNTVD